MISLFYFLTFIQIAQASLSTSSSAAQANESKLGVESALLLSRPSPPQKGESITTTFPFLNQYLYSERTSHTYIGFGLSPVTFLNSKLAISASIFQLHYHNAPFDLELLSVSYGFTFGQPTYTQNNFFLIRSIPKITLFSVVSIGPMIGYEFTRFPGLGSQLNKAGLYTPSQSFSTSGLVYGAALSETFHLDKLLLKINQIAYKETYQVKGTENGWEYYFDKKDINLDPTPIKPSFVFMLEISLLY